jgi:hypothetical protein
MHLDNYTPLKSIEINTAVSKHFEQILLIIVACLGLLGSVYIFADNTLMPSNPSESNFQLFSAAPIAAMETEVGDFEEYIDIDGDKRVGEELTFTFKGDPKASRYVLEMGDEMRYIITSNEFTYTYKKEGDYTLELKEIHRGLITVLATKKLKIKD